MGAARGRIGMKVVRRKMTSKRRVFGIGGCEEVWRSIFFGAEMRKARAPNERLCRGTESK